MHLLFIKIRNAAFPVFMIGVLSLSIISLMKITLAADDGVAPILQNFNSTSLNGTSTIGDFVNITAHFDEALDPASTMSVVLDTGATVILNAVSGSDLSGTYTVRFRDTSADLTVASITSASITSVDDAPPVTETSYSIANGNEFTSGGNSPVTGTNILDTSDIVIDGSPFRIVVGEGPVYSVLVGTKLYVDNQTTNNVSVIDTKTDTVLTTIPVGSVPYFNTVIGSKVYVINAGGSHNVSVIDTVSDTVTATINVATTSYAVTSVGKKLYVGSIGNKVSVIDTTNDTVTATITVGTSTIINYLTSVGTKVYVANGGESATTSSVSVIDSITDTVISTINVGATPAHLTLVGSKLFVINRATNNVTVIDTASDTVIATTSVGSLPSFATAKGNKLYVNNILGNSVSVINATTNLVTATIPVGTNPGFAKMEGNKLYVSNRNSSNISVIDTTTDTVTETIAVGATVGVPASAGNKLYVGSGNDTVTVVDMLTDTLVTSDNIPYLNSFTSSTTNGTYTSGQSINIKANFNKALSATSTMQVVLNTGATVTLGTVSGSQLSGTYLIAGGQTTPDLTVSSITSAEITDTDVIPHTGTSYSVPLSPQLTGDPTGNLGDTSNIVIGAAICSIAVGVNPYQLAQVGSYVYVANQGSNTVSVINTATNTATSSIAVGSQPYGVAATGTEIYVANLNGNTVSVINALNNTVTNTISVGFSPYYVAALGTNIYVTNNLSNTVSVISSLSHTVTNTISVGTAPLGIKAHGTDIYVANFGGATNYFGTNFAGGSVSVINSLTNTVSATIPVGSGPRGVAVLGNEVYVANFNDDTVSVINTGTNTVTNTIAVGTKPRGMLGSGTKVYVENFEDGTISVIDTASHTVTATVAVGNAPAGMVSVGNNIYLSRFTDSVVSIFNALNNTLRSSCDTSQPLISSEAATVGETTATISWTTDESSDSLLEYGLTTSYGSSVYSATLGTSHVVMLSGLTGSTLYHYRVTSVDSLQNSGTGSDHTFTTPAPAGGGGGGGGGSISGGSGGSTTPTPTPTPTPISSGPSAVPTGSPTPPLASAFYFFRNLRLFDIGQDVMELQKYLNSHGFTVTVIGVGSPGLESTFFGRLTFNALVRFQRYVGLPATGFFGPLTRQAVNSGSVPPTPTPTNPSRFQFLHDLEYKDESQDVVELQKFLNSHGFIVVASGPGSPGNEIDFFGGKTYWTLVRFQASVGLPQSGFFGPKTRAVINAMLK